MNQQPYWQKQDKPLFVDLTWNIPEQKQGIIQIIGGNNQTFHTSEYIATHLQNTFPLKSVQIILPDSLKTKLPPLENIYFMPSTTSGSFANSKEFQSASTNAENTPVNATILAGDFSKNSETSIAISKLIQNTNIPLYLARDTIDSVMNEATNWIEKPNITIIASMIQLQKLFRILYYPKMILLSAPINQIVESLHKFTLSYPCLIVTFHAGQIIIAKNGQVITTPIEKTTYTPISLWNGILTANIAVLNLFNPNKPLESASAALFY